MNKKMYMFFDQLNAPLLNRSFINFSPFLLFTGSVSLTKKQK